MKGVVDRIAVEAMYGEYPNIWFSNALYNGLMQYNPEENELKYIAAFPEERSSQFFMHQTAAVYGSQIVFFPGQGSHIHIADRHTWEIKTVPLDAWGPQGIGKIVRAFVVDRRIFLLPENLRNGMFLFHPEECRMETVKIDIEKIPLPNGCQPQAMFRNACLYKDGIYAPLDNTEHIVKIDLRTLRADIMDFKAGNAAEIEIVNGVMWILPGQGNQVFCRNMENGHMEAYTFDRETGTGRIFNNIVPIAHGIVLLPAKGKYIYFLREGKAVPIFKGEFPVSADNEIIAFCFRNYMLQEDKVFVLPYKYRQSIVIDTDMHCKVSEPLRLADEVREKLTKEILDDALNVGVTIGEEEFYSVSDFISKIEKG